jgi:ubiquinone biosynthesis O-methyltransferase
MIYLPTMYEYDKPGSTWDGSAVVFAQVFQALGHVERGARVLDVGCGNGYLTNSLAEQGFVAHGVDPSDTGIDVARRFYPTVTFDCIDLTRESLQLPSFDAATCIEVLEHVYAPRLLLAATFAALKPGGTLVLTTPYHGYLKNLAVVASGHFDKHFNPLWDHGHIKFFSMPTLELILREAGFEDVRIKGIGRAPYLWKTMLATGRKPRVS